MQNSNTLNNVVNLQDRRLQRTEEQRRLRNQKFADVILTRWSDTGPAGGQTLFKAILEKAVTGPIATKARAEVLLPVLLEMLDEIEAQEAHIDGTN